MTSQRSVAVPGTGHDPAGHVRWLEALSPWPEEFGLERMRRLLADLGEPQRRYPAIHLVGTNGKTSTTLLTAELLRAQGLHVGAYISPHVRGWAARVELPGASNLGLAVAAAEAHLARPVDPHAADALVIPGRLERRGERPLEIWDGAHNLAGIGYLLPRVPARDYILVVSILADKDADAMLRALTAVGSSLVATQSSNPRALPADELASLARSEE